MVFNYSIKLDNAPNFKLSHEGLYILSKKIIFNNIKNQMLKNRKVENLN